MVIRILFRQIDLGSFLMVAARSIILAIIFLAATSSTMAIRALGSPATYYQAVRLLFPGILALVLLPVVIDYLALVLWFNLKCWETFVGIFRSVVWFYSAGF
jgi:hypothetical protein